MEHHDVVGSVEDEEEEDDALPKVAPVRDEALGVSVPASVVEEIRRKFEEGSEDELVDEEEIHPDEMDSDHD